MIRSTIGAPWRFFKEFYGANVIKSVHVEAAYAGPEPVEETGGVGRVTQGQGGPHTGGETLGLEAVNKEHGFPNALVVFCDIEADDAEAQLDRHLAASSLT